MSVRYFPFHRFEIQETVWVPHISGMMTKKKADDTQETSGHFRFCSFLVKFNKIYGAVNINFLVLNFIYLVLKIEFHEIYFTFFLCLWFFFLVQPSGNNVITAFGVLAKLCDIVGQLSLGPWKRQLIANCVADYVVIQLRFISVSEAK